jgi:hypothetical protein
MKDYVRIDINSALKNAKVFEAVSCEFPEFSWRSGDSDAQGEYVSGTNLGGVQIQCWTSENPMVLSISFRNAGPSVNEREEILEKILGNLVPHIGEVVRLDA